MTSRLQMTFLGLSLLACPLLNGQNNCGVQQIQGTYVATISGFANYYPYSGLSVWQFGTDGTVNVPWEAVMFATGRLPVNSYSGTWTLTENCQFTVNTPTLTLKGMVVKNGQEIHMTRSSPLTTASTPAATLAAIDRLTRVTPDKDVVVKCSVAQLNGTYAKSCTGWMGVAAPPAPMQPLTFLGAISLPGDGSFSGGGSLVVGGKSYELQYQTGTINVSEDCTGAARYSLGTGSPTFNEVLHVLEQGKRILAVSVSSPLYTPTTTPLQIDLCELNRIDR